MKGIFVRVFEKMNISLISSARLLLFFGLFFSVPFAVERLTRNFKLLKFSLPLPSRKDAAFLDSNNSSEDLNAILCQKFYFLNKGLQSYVFVSADNKYVIKFILGENRIFSSQNIRARKLQKIEKLFSSFELAFNEAKKETALIYLHLSETKNLLPEILIQTPTKQNVYISLDRSRFAIQKKVSLLKETFKQCSNQEEELKKRIDSFLVLIRNRASKGLYNRDPNIGRNFGFLDQEAIELDFGGYELTKNPSENEYFRYKRKLRALLESKYPKMVPYLDSKEGF